MPNRDKVFRLGRPAIGFGSEFRIPPSDGEAVSSAPVNTVLPGTPTGTIETGETLTSPNTGTWSGTAPITYARQWYRGEPTFSGDDPIYAGSEMVTVSEDAIAGATGATYVLAVEDEGLYVWVQVTGTNDVGSSTADSLPVGPIEEASAATAPAQFSAGDWSIADLNTVDDARITITTLPSDGGSAITALQYQVDGGAWASLGGTTTGTYDIGSLTYNTAQAVAIRAVNAIGNGTASATKNVTPTADADADALMARFTTPPTTARAGLIHNLITAGKANGWWAELDVLVLPGLDSQCSLLNWKGNSAWDASLVSAPAFTADSGFVTDGAASYINTNYNPATAGGQFLQNDALFAVWHGSDLQRTNSTAGWFDGTDGVTMNPRTNTNTLQMRVNQAAGLSSANTNGSGLIAIERTGASAVRSYRNGASVGTGTNASTALNSAPLNIGRITAASYQVMEWRGHVIGGSMGTTLNASMYADILPYLQAIGAV